ncbi:class I lanthipeptide [Macellibacteroides fermentans]|uniref:Natural product n=1 Tax=Macellibacteroides fermentans TaxID=879969 RepID=A0A8E1ZYN1_9PORP|nr:class I lanthipeptide [Macellibacteroides fermentans]NYI50022.1 natural product precursor [Macellibacteroides fermentans]
MKKLKKLSLNKETITNLNDNEMKQLEGGLWDSRVCGTYFNGGGCYGTGSKNSCAVNATGYYNTALICF